MYCLRNSRSVSFTDTLPRLDAPRIPGDGFTKRYDSNVFIYYNSPQTCMCWEHVLWHSYFNFRCIKCAGDKHRQGCETRWWCCYVLLQVQIKYMFSTLFMLSLRYKFIDAPFKVAQYRSCCYLLLTFWYFDKKVIICRVFLRTFWKLRRLSWCSSINFMSVTTACCACYSPPEMME